MKITQTITNLYEEHLRVEIEAGDFKISFIDGEPEDNTINRNFNDVFKIVRLVRDAHQAGLRGEGLEIRFLQCEET